MKRLSLKARLLVSIVSIALIIFSVMTVVIANSGRDMAETAAIKKFEAVGKAYSNEMRLDIEEGMLIARTLATSLVSDKKANLVDRQPVLSFLKEILDKNEFLIGSWTGWESNAWDNKDSEFVGQPGHDKSGRFIPFYSRVKGDFHLDPLEGYEDEGTGDYYLSAKKRQKETMVEPYHYMVDGVDVLMTSAVVPIIIDGKFMGVAGVDIPLKEIQTKTNLIKPYLESEAYVVTAKGNYVSHPDEKKIATAANFPFEAEKFKDSILRGNGAVLSGFDPESQAEYIYIITPMLIGHTEEAWSLIIKTPLNVVMAEANALVRNQVLISLAGLFILLLAVLFFSHELSKSLTYVSGFVEESCSGVNVAIQHLSKAGLSLADSSS